MAAAESAPRNPLRQADPNRPPRAGPVRPREEKTGTPRPDGPISTEWVNLVVSRFRQYDLFDLLLKLVYEG